jgi:hypothetical protein
MTINFFPALQQDHDGCFSWGWYVACDLQIFLFLPFIIWGLEKCKPSARFTILACLIIGGLCLNAYLAWEYKLPVGEASPMSFYLFAMFLNKPYTKLYAVFMGVLMGFCFDHVVRKGTSSPLAERGWRGHFNACNMFCWGLFFSYIFTVINYAADLVFFIYTRTMNTVGLPLLRFMFLCFQIVLIVPLFFKYGKPARYVLSHTFFRVTGKLSFGVYLVWPIATDLYVG